MFSMLKVLVVAAVFCIVASASPIGHLSVANCTNGGVLVTLTTIDWYPPPGGGSGCDQTGGTTSVVYSGGTLTGGVQGTILDLTAGGGAVPDFMTFVGNAGLHFDLTFIGPGVSSTVCAATLNSNLPACSVAAGSPFILAPTTTGTSVTLSAGGNARDASGTGPWSGAFTTQIAGLTPAQVQSSILAGGVQNSTWSGDFLVGVPEPLTLSLIGSGLIAMGLLRRRR